MNLQLSGHHVEITPAIRGYINTKLERITRHFDQVIDINVIVSVSKLEHKVEATAHLPGKDIHAESVHQDMYAAVDLLTDKLDRAVLKHKEKLAEHRHEAGQLKRSQPSE